MMRWAGHAARMAEMRNLQQFGQKSPCKEATWDTVVLKLN